MEVHWLAVRHKSATSITISNKQLVDSKVVDVSIVNDGSASTDDEAVMVIEGHKAKGSLLQNGRL
jgi:glycine cleavage system H lipoate-binding protein